MVARDGPDLYKPALHNIGKTMKYLYGDLVLSVFYIHIQADQDQIGRYQALVSVHIHSEKKLKVVH